MTTPDKIHVFVVPPTGGTLPLYVDPATTTVNDVRSVISDTKGYPSNPSGHFGDSFQSTRLMTASGLLTDESATLEELGIEDGAVIRTAGRLCGGALLKLKIKTKFGCTCCCEHCSCDACSNGRKYDIQVNSIDQVSAIFRGIELQNPEWAKKKPKAMLITMKGVVLDPNNKILFYDLKPNEEIWLQLTPLHWFTGAFRSGGSAKSQEEEDEDAEFKRAVAAKKAEKKEQDRKATEEVRKQATEIEDVELV